MALLGQCWATGSAERDVAVLVLLLALAAYGPLRFAIGGVVRRLLVGRRGDRYDVVSGLAARLEESADVHRQLPALAAAVATAFKLAYVRVEVVDSHGTVSAAYGSAPAAVREVPIRYGQEEVGRLVLPASGMRSMLSKRDQELLLDVVRQAAMAIRSARLAADLQASRERLVLDREEDRRRIRRDLHDGLGPVLGGVAMRLDAAGNALVTDPAAARTMVEKSRHDITEALADVRRLVHGLRPPALDDLGLLDALHQQVERMRSNSLDIEVDGEPAAAATGRGRGGGLPDRLGGPRQHEPARPRDQVHGPARRRARRAGRGGRGRRRRHRARRHGRGRAGLPAGPGRRAGRPHRDQLPARGRHRGAGLAAHRTHRRGGER